MKTLLDSASLVSGGAAGKMPVGRFLIFITLWATLVYCPVARWTWHPLGWSHIRGAMDFAGGTAVHICSGSSVAACAVFSQLQARNWQGQRSLGTSKVRFDFGTWRFWEWVSFSRPKRTNDIDQRTNSPETDQITSARASSTQHKPPVLPPRTDEDPDDDLPYSINHMVLGTALLWVGWFGFNGGSALGANLRAVSACVATQTAASVGGTIGLIIGWGLSYWDRKLKKGVNVAHSPSMQEFCDGVIAALVAITPAAGYVSRTESTMLHSSTAFTVTDKIQVPIKYAPVFGVVGAVGCKGARMFFEVVLPADKRSIFAIHAGGGALGMLLTAFFAEYALPINVVDD